MQNVRTVCDLLDYLSAFELDRPVLCNLLDTAKTLIVVDSQGNASVHKIDRKRELLILIDLPTTDA